MPADTYQEFKDAAEARYKAAKKLYKTAGKNLSQLSSACYLAGYTVEMLLKAAIIQSFTTSGSFSDPTLFKTETKKFKCGCGTRAHCPTCHKDAEKTELKHKYRHHNLTRLMRSLQTASAFTYAYGHWFPSNETSDVFTQWNSERRYDAEWISSPGQARDFMKVVRAFKLAIRRGLR